GFSMTPGTKNILRYCAIGLGALIVFVVSAVLIVVHTDWFRNFVREKIVSATEDATGGKVDIGSFNFDVSHLRAVVTDFVIHGREPATAAPFLRAERLEMDLRLFTGIRHP